MKPATTLRHLLPVFGILLFILLYIVAAMRYPGGSDFDATARGFSWQHNYWCELMARDARNGLPNTGRPWALTAMFVLAISLSIFWYLCSISFNSANRKLIWYSGLFSMIVAVFLFVGPHDPIMIVSGLSGLFALTLVVINLIQLRAYGLITIGAICILLCALNNYIYYSGRWFSYLAIIQKITFLVFLYWFCAVTIYLFRRQRANAV